MALLIVDATDVGAEFKIEIQQRFNVILKDASDAFGVMFEGERENLIAMYQAYWTEGEASDFLFD